MTAGRDDRAVRYEPEDRPPALVTAGVGLQAAMTIIAPVALTVAIVARIAGQPDSYISWGVAAALLVSGVATILQAVRLGRIGSGHVLAMGTSGAFIAVCVAALAAGGPSLMASLIVVSSLIQFVLAARLSMLRRVFTPVVSGTVVMLIAVTVAPVLFDTMGDVPDGTARAAAPVAALATMVAVAALVLRGSPSVRLWSPVVGIVVGCAVAAPFGIYDTNAVVAAPWIGFPVASWPGFDLSPDADFWALLVPFVVVTIVGAVETIGDGIAIQQVSRRKSRATDFRVVQGALNADGVGNLLSGIAGTLPNTTYSSSLALAEVTGVAARRVGVVIGGVFVGVAFFPKISALLIAIPGPVAAGYLVVLIGLLFVQGMRLVVQDGPHSSEGRRRRSLVLAGGRLPEPVDLPRRDRGRFRRGAARERHDRGHDLGGRDGRLHGADGIASPAPAGSVGRRGPAARAGVPRCVRLESPVERGCDREADRGG